VPALVPSAFRVASSLTIQELEATAPGGQPRVVVLVGPALPLKGSATWDGDTQIVTAYYPGNPEATQQLLYPKDSPSDFSGEWNRTRMGRLPSQYTDQNGATHGVIEPMDLYQILDAIRIGGARVRVTWAAKGARVVGGGLDQSSSGVDWQIVREGRLKQVKITPDTEVDIKWSMNFDWYGRGDDQQKASDTRRDDDVAKASSAVQQAINALDFYVNTKVVSLTDGKRLSASTLTLGQLERLADAPRAAVDSALAKLRYDVGQFKRAVDVARKIGNTPQSISNSVTDFSRDVRAIANGMKQDFEQRPVEVMTRDSGTIPYVRAHGYFGRIHSQMTLVARAGVDLERRVRLAQVSGPNAGQVTVQESSTTRAGELVAVHLCKRGDTPPRLSLKYYGNPDHGDSILHANRLPTYTPQFSPGQIVIIPVLVNGPKAQ